MQLFGPPRSTSICGISFLVIQQPQTVWPPSGLFFQSLGTIISWCSSGACYRKLAGSCSSNKNHYAGTSQKLAMIMLQKDI
jgi:hypothetical protein